MRLLPLIILSIFTQALGTTLLSRGMKQVGAAITSDLDAARYGMVVLTTISNPNFIFGLLLLIAAFLLYLTLLSRADLSYVMPVTSFGYVITALLAVYLLGEEISIVRWCGIVLICTGVLLVSRGESTTAHELEGVKDRQ